MRRSAEAYLSDIIESCDAIQAALLGVGLSDYLGSRLIRSSVEREFITIGEAAGQLVKTAPDLGQAITHARMIVGFRNRLTHDYAAIDDEAVLRIAEHDVVPLRTECEALLRGLTRSAEDD